ncbi:uncharacterized protein LOC129907312 isoform X2 [Episyrphus balteatus]|uniref:uncharacterized protein LOC129907312 isoform X2 n=1 Tax=Episyrphus balteatus TaxID=286459 RepID=UPI0024868C97|nr:uncharacterized protein LOC129907312 isoform X2 [Episyrphus balteatus]
MAATAFEEEILALNPEYDLVFSKNNNENPSRTDSPDALEPHTRWASSPHAMKIISKMNEILNTKPLGELPTQQDWEDHQSCEVETINLMRKLGLEQSIDRPPDEKRTIATVPVSDDVIFMKNGRKKMSIFMSDSYFELKPRSEASFDLDEDATTPEESTTSDFSDEINIYQPIFESTQETESTTLSDDFEEQYRSRVAYQHLDSGVSSDSGKRKSLESEFPSLKPPHHQKNNRISYTKVGSKKLNDSGSSNTSNQSSSSSNSSYRKSRSNNNSWRSLNGSFSDVRDENNWRLNVTKTKEPEKKKIDKKPEEKKILNQTITLKPDTSNHDVVSNCGRALYKPKDLFMKKKAMMIQQKYF